ncbi:MAG TPA: hypothetical protein VK489_12790 [Ferruginibacter sp.]|nr:hypothetical protein [Ferruginibacter sp.]
MNDISKLTLSDEEQQLVNNSNWILTKRVIVEKVYHLFGNLSAVIGSAVEKETWLPLPVVRSTGKISRGENYRLLPYVLLDHPRCFDTENIFAVRTMFWWGNFFSITLQLSGTYKKMFEDKLSKNIKGLRANEFYLCINEDQWQHNFDEDNYIAVNQLTDEETGSHIRQKPFIKLAVKLPLDRWNEMPVLLERSFFTILELLRY